jgi:hypothetical protein
MIMCPVEEMGRYSVIPSTMASKRACQRLIVKKGFGERAKIGKNPTSLTSKSIFPGLSPRPPFGKAENT